MSHVQPETWVLQMRLVVEASDHEETVRFYRDVLGASTELQIDGEVAAVEAVTTDLVAAGAEVVAPPARTPWQSSIARLNVPAGLRVTVFQELEPGS